MHGVAETTVEELRAELRKLGYLSSGLERWFALDPVSSRTFWAGLLTIALKSATLITPFAILPAMIVMLLRNAPLRTGDILFLAVLYAAASFLLVLGLVVGVALLIRISPAKFVERQRLLLAVAVACAGFVVGLLTWWWSGFEREAPLTERVLFGLASLTLFVVSSYVYYAAFLSFSIHESHLLPSAAQRGRGRWILLTGAILLAVLVLPVAIAEDSSNTAAPPQIPVAPTSMKLAIVAVDGLSAELARSDAALLADLPFVVETAESHTASPPEYWATIATGVNESLHRVHSLEAIELRPTGSVLQSISLRDPSLTAIAPLTGLARRIALPPTVRQRDYLWEIVATRGVPVTSVNWWAAGSARGALTSISQETIFAQARSPVTANDPAALAIAIDREAALRFTRALDSSRVVTVYLPALDIVLNRLEISAARRVSHSQRALENLRQLLEQARAAGWEVVVIGAPGSNATGSSLIAASRQFEKSITAKDLAPTLLDLLGFPRSNEMKGISKLPGSNQETITTYGGRIDASPTKTDEEYFQNLRSLGYIK